MRATVSVGVAVSVGAVEKIVTVASADVVVVVTNFVCSVDTNVVSIVDVSFVLGIEFEAIGCVLSVYRKMQDMRIV